MPSREERERVAARLEGWHVLKGDPALKNAAALLRADAKEIAELKAALQTIATGRIHADNAGGDENAGVLMAGRFIGIARNALKGATPDAR